MLATVVLLLSPLLLAAPREVAVPKLSGEPVVDGRLDEPAWQQAAVLDDFTAFRPIEGQPAQHATRVLLFRDDAHLHVAFQAMDPDPSLVRATFSDRDAIWSDDVITLVLDGFENGRTGFYFVTNPYGIQADCVRTEDPENEDCSWDTVFYSAGRLTDTGYEVELTIPFASIRFDPDRDTWAVNVIRNVPRTGEKATWAPLDLSIGGLMKQSGRISGMSGIPQLVSYQLIPELTTRGGPGTSAGTALYDEREGGPWGGGRAADLGLTAKIARGGVAADFAINPDFSQVESDAAQIALNERFALFYDEKRPFFLEGRETFEMPWNAVYTRTIADPLYGVKLAGKEGSTAFSILHTLDQSPTGSVVDRRWSRDAYRKHDAITSVVRATTDLTPGLTAGILVTDKHVGNAWNRVGGVDAKVAVTDGVRLTGQVLQSATDHPDDTFDGGTAVKVRLFANTRRYNLFSWYEEVTPGFRAEVGFIPRVGYREHGQGHFYRFETGRKTGLVSVEAGTGGSILESTRDTDAERNVVPRLSLNFDSWRIFANHTAGWERFSGETFVRNRAAAGVSVNSFKWLEMGGELQLGNGIAYFAAPDPYLGGVARMGMGATIRPVDRVKIGVNWDRSIFSNDGVEDAFTQATGGKGDDIEFDANVVRLQTQVFLTQAISGRVIADWSDIENRVLLSALLAYRPGPGTVVYLGWQDRSKTHRAATEEDNRAVFLKLSYLFRS